MCMLSSEWVRSVKDLRTQLKNGEFSCVRKLWFPNSELLTTWLVFKCCGCNYQLSIAAWWGKKTDRHCSKPDFAIYSQKENILELLFRSVAEWRAYTVHLVCTVVHFSNFLIRPFLFSWYVTPQKLGHHQYFPMSSSGCSCVSSVYSKYDVSK